MKNLFFILIFSALNTLSVKAQLPNWKWAKSAGGFDTEIGRKVCSDNNGNVIITGVFLSPSLVFGTDTVLNINATTDDVYVVKYDSSGNVLWAKSDGGSQSEDVFGLCTDQAGNIFIAGHFDSPTITFGTTTLTNSGSSDIFIVKYDSSGNIIWAKRAGGNLYDNVFAISIDSTGNVLATGAFQSSTIIFDSITLTNVSPGDVDIFVVKYNQLGNVIWAKSSGGSSFEISNSICSDANGNVFITGFFESPSITFGTITLNNTGAGDLFVVKLDSSGNFIWAKSAVGIADDSGNDITTDASGNIVVTGSFDSSSLNFGTTTLTNANGLADDILVVKYDMSGNVLWAKSSGGGHVDRGFAISIDNTGNVLVTGAFQSGTILFGTTILNNVTFGEADIFTVKYDSSGNVHWAIANGGSLSDFALDIYIDINGDILISGRFDGPTLTFGSTTLLNNTGFGDIYVAKLGGNISTGIGEQNTFFDPFSILPNPSTGQFTIKSSVTIDEITIKTLQGQVINKLNPNENNSTFLLNSSGIYFLQITFENKTITKKLIVQVP